MKTNVLLLTLLLITGVASAQEGTKFFSLGLRAGANLSQFSGNDLSLNNNNGGIFQLKDNSSRVWGATGGIFMRIGRTFYVQPEIMFSQKGGQFSLYDGTATNKKSFKMTNLDFPVMFGVKIARFLRINAGPVAVINIGHNGDLEDAFNDYTNEDNFDSAFRRTALGYQAGIGLDFGKLNFDIRYEGNLTDVVNLKLNNPQAQAQFERKVNLLQATIGVAF